MVAGLPPAELMSQDSGFQARWQAALEAVPPREREIKQKIMEACSDIELELSTIQRDLRD